MNPLPQYQDLEKNGEADHGSVDAAESKVSVSWYAVLALFLFVPFFLREVSPQLEPYPAILFPVGATMTNLEDSVLEFLVLEVYAVMPDNSERKIQPNDFLGRIPVQYFRALVDRRFGLEPREFKSRWSNRFEREKHWTSAERRSTMEWMIWRAQENGTPDARAFRFRKSIRLVSISTGEVIDSREWNSYDLVIEHE